MGECTLPRGVVCLEIGNAREAEELSLLRMKVRKKMLRADNRDVLCAAAIAASIYTHQDRWEVAEKFRAQVIEMSKRKLGADHPNTLTSIVNLALTH